jgi:hypothetical protein
MRTPGFNAAAVFSMNGCRKEIGGSRPANQATLDVVVPAAGEDIRLIDWLVRKYGLSAEGRLQLHDAIEAIKIGGRTVGREAAEVEAESIAKWGGKFVVGGEEGFIMVDFSLVLVLDELAIAWAVHDIGSAWAGPQQQPATAPLQCKGGTYVIPGTVTGFSVQLLYPGCAGAWDHAQVNAQTICDNKLTCSGTCPNGTPCSPIAILTDRVNETSYLVTCEAEGRFICECGCIP